MRKLSFLLIAVVFFASCSSLSITSDYDDMVNFNEFTTYSYYGWAKDSDQILNQFDKKRLEDSFAHEFDIRGIEYVETGGDIVVSLFIVVNQKTATTAYTDYYGAGYGGYYGYGPGWGWGGGMSSTTYSQYDYLVGTLVCDVFETATRGLIWQGVASGTVDSKPANRERKIPKTVAAIMAQYPVKPIKR